MRDIVSIRDNKDWLVVGWFTPDYHSMAETFSEQLYRHKVPFHLLAKPSVGRWDTSRKPTVVLEAMEIYPGKTIVLMDVDCVVSGDVEPVTRIDGDVGVWFGAARRRSSRRKISIAACSRVVVFRPTSAANAFAKEWERQCELCAGDGMDDEGALGWTLLSSTLARHSHLDLLYAGREIGYDACEKTVVAHITTHIGERPIWLRPLRAIERLFRKGMKYHQPVNGVLVA